MTYRRTLRTIHSELVEHKVFDEAPPEVWRRRPRAAWQDLAQVDKRLATLASAYVAATSRGRELAICSTRPAAYDRERTMVVGSSSGDSGRRAHLKAMLDLLWDHIPYGVDPAARCEVLPFLGPRTREARRYWEEVITLAVLLAKSPAHGVAVGSLPLELRFVGDEELIGSAAIAHRIAALPATSKSTVVLEKAALALLHEKRLVELAQLYEPARFVRRLARSHSLAVQMLCFSSYVSLKTPPAFATLAKTWNVVDELVVRLGFADGDPFSASRGRTPALVSDEVLEHLEIERLFALNEQAERTGGTAAWERTYAGWAGLREMLAHLDADLDRVTVERLPYLPSRPHRERRQGVEDDREQLELDQQAELFVTGVQALAERADELRAWVVAWASICRPRESLPCAEDLVELPGGGYAVYLDRETSKSGRRECYISSRAATVTGVSPSWFPTRQSKVLRDTTLQEHAQLLREACRTVRATWVELGHDELPDRLAYVIRKLGADRLRWGLAGRFHVLTRVLGHLSGVTDAPYTELSESEFGLALLDVSRQLTKVLP